MIKAVSFGDPRWIATVGVPLLLLAQPAAAGTSSSVVSFGTARIETAAAIRIVENADTRLELSQPGLAVALSRGPGEAAIYSNFQVLTLAPGDGATPLVETDGGSGVGSNFANEALSVSVSDGGHQTKKVIRTLTIILANYY